MKKPVHVAKALQPKVAEWIEASALDVEMADGDTDGLRIVSSPEPSESSGDTLVAGGWIRCATARQMATEYGLPLRSLGELLDLLEIKIRACSLGCFD